MEKLELIFKRSPSDKNIFVEDKNGEIVFKLQNEARTFSNGFLFSTNSDVVAKDNLLSNKDFEKSFKKYLDKHNIYYREEFVDEKADRFNKQQGFEQKENASTENQLKDLFDLKMIIV